MLIEDGRIVGIGSGAVDRRLYADARILDAKGRLVTPGLVDAHTHLVFGGWRAHELPLKMAGVPICRFWRRGRHPVHGEGHPGGQRGRADPKAEMALQEMLSLGTTTCEAKSGYGLNLADEIKQMKAVAKLNQRQSVQLVSTLMAAHAVPPEYKDNRQGFIDLIIHEIIPATAREQLADFCDIFCETGVFSPEESRKSCWPPKSTAWGLKSTRMRLTPSAAASWQGNSGPFRPST